MAHTLQGIVTSDKRDKTITVSIVSRETHPLYRKQYTKTRKYTAHDETGPCMRLSDSLPTIFKYEIISSASSVSASLKTI